MSETITPICTVSVENLKAAVAATIKPVNKKAKHEILRYFHCQSNYLGLTFTGYDLHTGISTKIPNNCRNSKKFLLPAHPLKDAIKKHSGDCVISSITREDENLIQLSLGKMTIEFSALGIEDYPQLPEWDDSITSISLDANVLSKAITSCKKFTKNDNYDNVLNGINFSSKDGFFSIQSTNTYGIARLSIPKNLPEFSLTVLPDNLKLPKTGKATLKFYSEHIAIENEGSLVFVKTIQEKFPEKLSNWKAKIQSSISLDKKALLTQLDIALAYSKDMIIHIYTTENTLRLMGECIDGSFFVELPANIFRDSKLTSVSAKYLRDAISLIRTKTITLDFDCDWNGETTLLGIIDSNTSFFMAKYNSKIIPTWIENKTLTEV